MPKPRHDRRRTSRANADALLVLVQQHAGLSLRDLKEKAGRGWGSLYNNLERLVEEGKVEYRRIGRRGIVIPTGLSDQAVAEIVALGYPKTRMVARAICETPGSGCARVADRVGLSPNATYAHLRRLLKAGLIVRASRSEGYSHLEPTKRLRELLDAP